VRIEEIVSNGFFASYPELSKSYHRVHYPGRALGQFYVLEREA
jgi:hypothetical protein